MHYMNPLPIRKYILLFILSATAPVLCFSQTGTISGIPAVWLKADTGRDTPTIWEDQSGHEKNAMSSTNTWPSKDTVINYNPALFFDGIDYNISVPFNFDQVTENSVMVVYHSYDTTEMGIWGSQNTLYKLAMLSTKRALGPDSVLDIYAGQPELPMLNTLIQNWTEKSETIINEVASLTVGGAGTGRDIKPLNGALAELIVFDRKLTFLEKVQFQTYLAIKYGISLEESNYVSSTEQVLWHGDNDREFNHWITGIGRDDAFGLYQKQSANVLDTTSILLLSAGEWASSNKENVTTINSGDFVLLGDNGAALQLNKSDDENNPLSILDRRWLVKASGSSVSTLSTEIHIDISQFPKDSLGYWMVIDRSGSGDFSVNNLEYKEADIITEDSIAIFQNMQWDTDLSGKDMFGFASILDFLVAVQTINDPTCSDRSSGEVLVNVVNGKGPFNFTMSHTSSEINREWSGGDKEVQRNLTHGKYLMTVTAENGQMQEREFVLILTDGPIVDLGEDQILDGKNPITLDATQLVPDSISVEYEWRSNFGFYSTKEQISVTESGMYTATVTDKNTGCYYSDNIIISGSDRWKFIVYPTTSNDGAYNASISLTEPGSVNMSIYDIGGALHYQVEGDGKREYQFRGVIEKTGTYVMYVRTPEGTKSQKLIVY